MKPAAKQGRNMPRLFLLEETATLEQLRSYLKGFLCLKGRTAGKFECGSSTEVEISPGLGDGEYMVSILFYGEHFRSFHITRDELQVISSREPPARDTDAFHAYFVTGHLQGHLTDCYQEKIAAKRR